MRDKLLTAAVMAAVLGGIGVFIGTFSRAVVANPEPEAPPPAEIPYTLENVAAPTWLQIPSIDVSAAVQAVGISKKGNMSSPSNFTDVGWYRYGTPPGQRGSAVIAGHLDNGLALSGVLKRLQDVRIGETISIRTEVDQVLNFRVTEIETYPYQGAPRELIFNRDDAARLNIITCAGEWIASEKTYSQRLVVFAVLEP